MAMLFIGMIIGCIIGLLIGGLGAAFYAAGKELERLRHERREDKINTGR